VMHTLHPRSGNLEGLATLFLLQKMNRQQQCNVAIF
jgi:hypothetical protein